MATSGHTISTAAGTFKSTIRAGNDNRLETSDGSAFDGMKPHGLNLSASINGALPDSANDSTVDVKYGFAVADSVIKSTYLALASNDSLSHKPGTGVATGKLHIR